MAVATTTATFTPSDTQTFRRRKRKAMDMSDDPAEYLTKMSVRGLDLDRYSRYVDGVIRCAECEKTNIFKTFKNKYSFQRHAYLFHEGDNRKIFPCPLCGKEFSRPDKMKIHKREKHSDFDDSEMDRPEKIRKTPKTPGLGRGRGRKKNSDYDNNNECAEDSSMLIIESVAQGPPDQQQQQMLTHNTNHNHSAQIVENIQILPATSNDGTATILNPAHLQTGDIIEIHNPNNQLHPNNLVIQGNHIVISGNQISLSNINSILQQHQQQQQQQQQPIYHHQSQQIPANSIHVPVSSSNATDNQNDGSLTKLENVNFLPLQTENHVIGTVQSYQILSADGGLITPKFENNIEISPFTPYSFNGLSTTSSLPATTTVTVSHPQHQHQQQQQQHISHQQPQQITYTTSHHPLHQQQQQQQQNHQQLQQSHQQQQQQNHHQQQQSQIKSEFEIKYENEIKNEFIIKEEENSIGGTIIGGTTTTNQNYYDNSIYLPFSPMINAVNDVNSSSLLETKEIR